MNLDQIASQFYSAGLTYSAAIQPYALKLFFALLLIDIITTWIQYTAEGQVDPSFFLGRMIKHVLSGGLIYLMIVNAFPWMNAVIKSFSAIGARVSGFPNLSPQSVLQAGGQIANMIFSAPASTSMVGNLEIAIVQSISGFAVLFAFTLTAAMLLFTLVEAYIVIGGGVILLGFGGSRFTASASEGYFPFVIRVGVRLLFYYLVLAVGMQLVANWSAALLAACKPVTTALPFWTTYGLPPSKIMTTVCSGGLSTHDMLNYTIGALVFAFMTVGIPHTVASLVGGSIGLALAHAFEAAFIARTIVRPISSALQTGFSKVSQVGSRDFDNKSEAANRVATWNFNRAQHIGNLGPDQGPRVPAPTDVGPTKPLNGTPNASNRTASMPTAKPTTKI